MEVVVVVVVAAAAVAAVIWTETARARSERIHGHSGRFVYDKELQGAPRWLLYFVIFSVGFLWRGAVLFCFALLVEIRGDIAMHTTAAAALGVSAQGAAEDTTGFC